MQGSPAAVKLTFDEAVRHCDGLSFPGLEGQAEYNRKVVAWIWSRAGLGRDQAIDGRRFDELLDEAGEPAVANSL